MTKQILLFCLLLASGLGAWGNNIRITNATLVDRNTSAGVNSPSNYAFVQFDLAWDNSWRSNVAPGNWDAAWVFIKFRVDGGGSCAASGWRHASLSTTAANHSIVNNNGVATSITPTADGLGVFIYRSANGSGNVNFQSVKLRWNYGANGVLDACQVTLRVLATEMVYVPEGSFYAGDGMAVPDRAQFSAGSSTAPLQITSEAALTLGGTALTNLGNSNRNRQNAPTDDFDNSTTRTLPAAFPKGYQAFYCMKYELSQEQYVNFLNSLDGVQQSARTTATTAGTFMGAAAAEVAPSGRNGIRCQFAPSGTTAGIYVNDLNGNGTYNEADDGLAVACNMLSYADAAAYADWSGLRLMTELEFEKACRGPNYPVPQEYAWGTTGLTSNSYSLTPNTGGRTTETMNNAHAGLGNAINGQNLASWPEAYRSGLFATSSSNRITSGATYYGIMDMSGNLAEYFVGLGSNSCRTYTGLHGNGTLLSNGNADVDYWVGVNGSSNRGDATGVFNGSQTGGVSQAPGIGLKHTINREGLRVSDRNRANYSANTRAAFSGFRGVRTAP